MLHLFKLFKTTTTNIMKRVPNYIRLSILFNGRLTYNADNRSFSFYVEGENLDISLDDVDVIDYESWYPEVYVNGTQKHYDRYQLIKLIGERLDDHIKTNYSSSLWSDIDRYNQEINAIFN